MSDILDYIRAKLATNPLTSETVESALSDARREFGGDTVYIRCQPRRAAATGNTSSAISRNCMVSKRTAQRWLKSL